MNVKRIMMLLLIAILCFTGLGLYQTFAPNAAATEEAIETTLPAPTQEPEVVVIEMEATPTPEPILAYESESYEAICMSDLNLRDEHGDYITTVKAGEFVEVIGVFNDERLNVVYDGIKGNVLNRLLPTKGVAISMTEVNLRDEVGDVMTLLSWGQILSIKADHIAPEGRTWVKIDSGEEGSVLSESIQRDFVLIDRRSQFVALYMDGNLVIGGPCVTGRVTTNRETPAGVFYLMDKVTDTWLTGKDWCAHVTYWMPFCAEGRIGMHDADEWRSEYGGEIYYNGGSHGCINEPFNLAETIYNNIWVGFPIIVR